VDIAKFDDISINYKVYGIADEVILLISGLGCDHKVWSFLIPTLIQKHKVIVFDNRAVGQTLDKGQSFSISTMSNDCYRLLKYLNFTKAHIVGHSMGGSIAQQFAISYPDITHKLIAINAIAYTPKKISYLLNNQNNLWRKNNLPKVEIIKMFLPWILSSQFLENDTYMQSFINASLNETNPQNVDDHLRQINALVNCDLRNELEQITHQTLVISSKEDALAPPYLNNEIAQHIKNSQTATIPGGHASQIEYPEVLAHTILKFLD